MYKTIIKDHAAGLFIRRAYGKPPHLNIVQELAPANTGKIVILTRQQEVNRQTSEMIAIGRPTYFLIESGRTIA